MYHLLKETKVSFKSFLFYIESKLEQKAFPSFATEFPFVSEVTGFVFGPIYHKFKKHEDAQPDKK